MRQILERIDVTPNQVLLEATIAEVRLNDDLKMGVRWFFQMGNHQLKLTDSAAGCRGPAFPGFSYFFSTPNVQVVLNALSTITDVNIVSSPTLMVIDNKRATLQVGNEVPIATQSAVAVLTPGSPIVNSVTYRSTGIVLNITPRIDDSGPHPARCRAGSERCRSDNDLRHRLPHHSAAAHQDDGFGQRRRGHRAGRIDPGPGRQQARAGATGRPDPGAGQSLQEQGRTPSPGPSCWSPSRRASSRIPRKCVPSRRNFVIRSTSRRGRSGRRRPTAGSRWTGCCADRACRVRMGASAREVPRPVRSEGGTAGSRLHPDRGDLGARSPCSRRRQLRADHEQPRASRRGAVQSAGAEALADAGVQLAILDLVGVPDGRAAAPTLCARRGATVLQPAATATAGYRRAGRGRQGRCQYLPTSGCSGRCCWVSASAQADADAMPSRFQGCRRRSTAARRGAGRIPGGRPIARPQECAAPAVEELRAGARPERCGCRPPAPAS